MAKIDRQQARLRTLAVSHLNIATSYLDQAKSLIKGGQATGLAIQYMQRALNSIEGAHGAIPLADYNPATASLSMTLDEVTAAQERVKQEADGTPSEPVTVGAHQS